MSDDMFLVDNNELIEITYSPYESEAELQILLEKHPMLLAGQQIDPDDPRHFLLIAREAGIPSRRDGPDQWSADHLFIDQDGIPTIVEVKRSSDTRIRREIVGQMLDYAANGVKNWPGDRLLSDLELRLGSEQLAEDAVLDLLERAGIRDPDVADFWSQVDDNLTLGRVRLLFVADMIPDELRAVIEFLNEQMDRCEVLGIEIRRYHAQGRLILVSRVVGHKANSRRRKEAATSRPFEDLLAHAAEPAQTLERQLRALAEQRGWTITTVGKSRRYTPSAGVPIARLFPADREGSIEFPFAVLENAGLGSEAAQLRVEMEAFADRKLSHRLPWVDAPALLDRWSDFADGWLPRFESAIAKAVKLMNHPAPARDSMPLSPPSLDPELD